MWVSAKDMALSPEQELRLAIAAGPRYNTVKRELTLTAEKFPNRVENKRCADTCVFSVDEVWWPLSPVITLSPTPLVPAGTSFTSWRIFCSLRGKREGSTVVGGALGASAHRCTRGAVEPKA